MLKFIEISSYFCKIYTCLSSCEQLKLSSRKKSHAPEFGISVLSYHYLFLFSAQDTHDSSLTLFGSVRNLYG